MKKNLRLLCLGLAAATFTCGFAQDDVTSELQNADMELGLKGWAFDGTDYMGKNTKYVNSNVGFHGMNLGVQETWHSDANNPLGDSYVMQRVKKLPAGTYVFGAYVGATKQTRNQTKSNRDSICGVSLFANDAKVSVATDNPDLARSGYKWAHSSKFNVATTVSDEGTLLVGLKVEGTNANYIVWDNATLYYFSDMSEADALDAMAQIDMERAVAIADTLTEGIKMHEDTLKNLKSAIDKVKGTKTTAATLWANSEDLFWNMGLARRSATDYANLLEKIEFANYIKDDCVWSEDGKELYFGDFEDVLEDAQKAYDKAETDRAELTELTNELTRQIGWVRLDSFYTARQELQAFINSDNTFTDEAGKYTTAQKQMLQAYDVMLGDTLRVIEDPANENPRPQDLYPFIEEIYATIAEVKNNPYDGIYVWSQTLPQTTAAIGGRYPLAGSIECDLGYEYTSPLIEFDGPAEAVRLTVTKVSSDQIYFCISSLEFFDKDGNEIPLDEASFTSNADHNSFGSADGQSYKGLVDDDPNTYFHSKWSDGGKINGETVDHYLEVYLPNGGYDAVSFKMVSRAATQKHQFPGEIVVTTPEVNHALNNLTAELNDAKALNAYCGTDPGFYTGEEGPEFAELAAAILEAELLLADEEAASTDMAASRDRLRLAINNFKLLEGDKVINVPVAGKVYRIVSGYPGFFDKQGVEKALTVHTDTIQSLWWQNVCADSLQQEFIFEPILDEDGEPYVEQVKDGQNEDGSDKLVPYYCYHLKNVATGLYVDSAFVKNQVKLVETPSDTVRLKWLGRGQWNIMLKLKNGTLHCGDHNGGNVGGDNGAYGGTWGVSSAIVSWGGGLDEASAWFIREYPELPLEVLVENGEFKSECYHFDATDSLSLTADAACGFDGLKLYDLYGSPISFNVKVEGAVATIKTEKAIPACAFAFNNKEGVAKVTLDIVVPEEVEEVVDMMAELEEKLEAVLVVAPEQGAGVGQYDDIAEYTTAVEAAEAMVEVGAEDEAIKAMIAQLDSAVAHLKNPHMPEAGKYYFIVSGLSAFEKNLSYNVALYPKNSEICWAQENELDDSRCWMFEPATVAELFGLGLDSAAVEKLLIVNEKDTTVNAYYVKNLGSGEYFGNIAKAAFQTNAKVPMASGKTSTVPYKVSMLGSGTAIGLDEVVTGQRVHALGHGSGKNKSGNITYWAEGFETASAWRIVETENDFVIFSDLDFTEIEPEAPVVKGVYDLFGRRLVAPTTPGIYIIDGKKRVIK